MVTSTDSQVAISFYETQLIRSQLTNDNCQILNQLGNQNRLVIFTNSVNRDLISQLLTQYKITNCDIIEFQPPRFNAICRFVIFLLRWSEPSKGTYRLAYREFTEGRTSRSGLAIRLSLWRALSGFAVYKRILRKFLIYAHALSSKNSGFENLPKVDLLILTSITNLDDEIPLGLWFKNRKCVVVGSVRSWDNLVTKGGVSLEPDIFLANSEFIRECAVRNQSFCHESIEVVPSSYYQQHLKPARSTMQLPNIAYACLGPSLNPDEVNFINLLDRLSFKLDIQLTIVQHPQFPHKIEQGAFKHLNFVSIKYSEASLQDFYNQISKFSLVIGGGTSFLLDAAFLGIPVYAINFEVEPQKYWKSALRAFDVLPHTKSFFEKCKVPIINNERELMGLFKDATSGLVGREIRKENLEYFVGSSHKKFAEMVCKVLGQSKLTQSYLI